MTSKEKIELLRETITYFYEKEGRSFNYISQVLHVDRKMLTAMIREWGLIKADGRHLTPSNYKFFNAHKQEILNMIDSDMELSEMAKRLNISPRALSGTIIASDKELTHHWNLAKQRRVDAAQQRLQSLMDKSSYNYNIEEIDGEEWREVLGYPRYMISNMGRVKSYSERYKSYHEIIPNKNSLSGRYYVAMVSEKGESKTYSLARLVAHAFVEGYSPINNTVDHINGNITDNRAENLEWVSQSENNQRKYNAGFAGRHPGYSKRGKFRSVVLDDKYEFKTIRALGKFLGVSETQAARYIDGESESSHKFSFTY